MMTRWALTGAEQMAVRAALDISYNKVDDVTVFRAELERRGMTIIGHKDLQALLNIETQHEHSQAIDKALQQLKEEEEKMSEATKFGEDDNDETKEEGDRFTFFPVLDSLTAEIAVFKLTAPAPVEPSEEPKFHCIIERAHWEAMGRPGQIKVPVMVAD